ncbi:hypothetical protein AAG906_010470 [Vitis piasezkii]
MLRTNLGLSMEPSHVPAAMISFSVLGLIATDEFKAIPICNCGGMRVYMEDQQRESFQATSRASSPTNASRSRKDRPLCTHCNILGHTVDRCYKIHGYPPGFRNRPNFRPNGSRPNQMLPNSLHTNQLTLTDGSTASASPPPLTHDQHNQLLALLSLHSSSGSSASFGDSNPLQQSISNFMHLDFRFRATHHVCTLHVSFYSFIFFQHSSLYPLVQNTNHRNRHHSSSPHLMLEHVLYIPTFQFNLISISALTQTNSFPLIFLLVLLHSGTIHVIGMGRRQGNLYLLDSSVFRSISFVFVVDNNTFAHVKNCGISD